VAKRRRGGFARLGRALLLALAAWVAVTVAVVVAFRWIDPPTTAFMLRDRAVALLTRDKDHEFRHEWRNSPRGSTYAVDNVIGVDWPLVGPWVNALLRRYVFTEGMLREWTRHQVEEVGLLPHFLPQLYAQRNDRNIYELPAP